MREFSYKARSKDGQLISGKIEAETESAAASVLLGKNLIPVDVKDSLKSGFSIPFFKKIPTKEKVMVIRQLATMIGAGLPISQALSSLSEQETNAKVREMLQQLVREIEAGSSLSSAFNGLDGIFSEAEISVVAAGESSGTLDDVLKRMADQAEKNFKNMKKIRGAFIYPGFLFLVACGVGAMVSIYVMPQMEGLYSSFGGAKLPLLTRFMIRATHFMADYFMIIAVILVAIILAIRSYVKTKTGRYIWDSLKIRTPQLGKFLQLTYLSLMMRTLENLIGSGVPILDAISITGHAMSNVIYKEALEKVGEDVKSGKSLSAALIETDIFPGMVPEMIRVGEHTGELDKMCKNLADYFDDEVDNWVRNFQALLEPVMLVFMGLVIGVIIISIMLPIYNFGAITQTR